MSCQDASGCEACHFPSRRPTCELSFAPLPFRRSFSASEMVNSVCTGQLGSSVWQDAMSASLGIFCFWCATGRCTGEAFVQLSDPAVTQEALETLNRQHIGARYIEWVLQGGRLPQAASVTGFS